MAFFELPLRTDLDDYEIEVELSGVAFKLRLTWNYREEFWYLTISDTEDTVIAGNLKVVVDKPLMLDVPGIAKPQGNLIAIDTSNSGLRAGLTDLGERVKLIWSGT